MIAMTIVVLGAWLGAGNMRRARARHPRRKP